MNISTNGIRDLIFDLDINESNFLLYLSLLSIPTQSYRPLLKRIITSKISIHDFISSTYQYNTSKEILSPANDIDTNSISYQEKLRSLILKKAQLGENEDLMEEIIITNDFDNEIHKTEIIAKYNMNLEKNYDILIDSQDHSKPDMSDIPDYKIPIEAIDYLYYLPKKQYITTNMDKIVLTKVDISKLHLLNKTVTEIKKEKQLANYSIFKNGV